MNNNFVLYLHVSPSGKKYFGITGQAAKKRWNNGHGYKENEHFWRAIVKYGWDNIKHIILADDLTKEEACFFERVMIALYNTTNPNNGYNNSTGGEYGASGHKHSEETKQKLSEANKGENNWNYGRTGGDNPNAKTVMCITTGHCFGSTVEAGKYGNTHKTTIRKCCSGRYKSAGKLNGEKLVWKYVSDLPRPQLTESDKVHLRYLLDKYGRVSA